MRISKDGGPVGTLNEETLELDTDDQELKALITDVQANGFDEPTGGEKAGSIWYGRERLELGPRTMGLLAMRLEDEGYEAES